MAHRFAKRPSASHPYYVYDLIDPRTGTVFYTGSGTGARHKSSLVGGSAHKRETIARLRKAGLTPESRIVAAFATRAEANSFEWERQRSLKLPNTPSRPAPVTQMEKKPRLNGLPPVETWCGEPDYGRRLALLPRHCVPSWEPEPGSALTFDRVRAYRAASKTTRPILAPAVPRDQKQEEAITAA